MTSTPRRKEANFPRGCSHRKSRHGAAVVELAVTLPMVVLLLLGAIEIGRAISVQHTLTEAARAACRVYCVSDNTPEQARAMVDAALEDSGFEGYTITLDPPTSGEIDTQLEPITVTVSIPYENVTWMSPWFMNGKTVTGSVVMPADTGNYGTTGSSSGGDDGGSSGGSSGGWSGWSGWSGWGG